MICHFESEFWVRSEPCGLHLQTHTDHFESVISKVEISRRVIFIGLVFDLPLLPLKGVQSRGDVDCMWCQAGDLIPTLSKIDFK